MNGIGGATSAVSEDGAETGMNSEGVPDKKDPPFISYSQNFEDLMLWRALKNVNHGTYIDVGAWDPTTDSVTLAFYQRNWRGVNIEPNPDLFSRFLTDRPLDLNLNICAGESFGKAPFYIVGGTGLSTMSAEIASQHESLGLPVRSVVADVLPLEAVCERHISGPIHFLKIDAEGSERAVLAGCNFELFRPWIVVIEATAPNSMRETHDEWEHLLTGQGYKFVWFDGLNRFYLASEHTDELSFAFSSPPNVFDNFKLTNGHPFVWSTAAPLLAEDGSKSYTSLEALPDPFVANEPVSLNSEERIAMTLRCRDGDSIPRVSDAGKVHFQHDGSRIQILHNGLRVIADGYCGSWMTKLIESARGIHEPQEEAIFHEVLKHIPPGAAMIELGAYWAYYSLWFLLGEPRRRALALEPDPVHLQVGRLNAELNQLEPLFVQGAAGGMPASPEEFATESSGIQKLATFSVPQLMSKMGIEYLDVLHCDAQGAEYSVLQGCEDLLKSGRVGWIFLSTHAHSISGDPVIHQRCLALLSRCGGVVVAEHDVHESFSGDGLIVARFGQMPLGWRVPAPVSYNRYSSSLFRNPLFDLAEAVHLNESATTAFLRSGGRTLASSEQTRLDQRPLTETELEIVYHAILGRAPESRDLWANHGALDAILSIASSPEARLRMETLSEMAANTSDTGTRP